LRLSLLCVPVSVFLLGWGCAASDEDDDASAGAGPSASSAASGGAGGAGATAGAGQGGDIEFDGGQGGGERAPLLYVHTNTTLYTGDPSASPLELTAVGDFDCIGGDDQDPSMTDIAVNEAGEVWAISESKIYLLEPDGATVHCAHTVELNNPAQINFYGLTFAPKGVLGADEVLIAGNSAGELWSVDATGQLSQRGTFGQVPANDGNGHSYQFAGQQWELSGDIVISANNGNPIGFATVRDCPDPPSPQGCNVIDTLIEIDVAKLATATTGSVTKSVRGQVLKQSGCSDSAAGYGSVFGVAAWNDAVYGFSRPAGSNDGYAVQIANTDGTACLIQAFSGQRWAGAGITTLAPVVPPPPK
jgi:hypothetical protein